MLLVKETDFQSSMLRWLLLVILEETHENRWVNLCYFVLLDSSEPSPSTAQPTFQPCVMNICETYSPSVRDLAASNAEVAD